jgi:methionyl-tRNA synthetase
MLRSYFEGVLPEPTFAGAESDLPEVIATAVRRYDEEMLAVRPTAALAAVYDVVVRANRYMVEQSPWTLAKDPARRDELGSILYASAETLRSLAILLSCIMPSAAERMWDQLGIEETLDRQRLDHAAAWGLMAPGTRTTKGESLFPRVDAVE